MANNVDVSVGTLETSKVNVSYAGASPSLSANGINFDDEREKQGKEGLKLTTDIRKQFKFSTEAVEDGIKCKVTIPNGYGLAFETSEGIEMLSKDKSLEFTVPSNYTFTKLIVVDEKGNPLKAADGTNLDYTFNYSTGKATWEKNAVLSEKVSKTSREQSKPSTGNRVNSTVKVQPSTSANTQTSVIDQIAITKTGAGQFSIKVPEGVSLKSNNYVFRPQNGNIQLRYPVSSGKSELSVIKNGEIVGTLSFDLSNGQKLTTEQNTQPPNTSEPPKTSQSDKKEEKEDSKNVKTLADGVDVSSTVHQEIRKVKNGWYYYNKKVNVTDKDLTVKVPEGKELVYISGITGGATNEDGSVTFKANQPVIYGFKTKGANELENIYSYNPNGDQFKPVAAGVPILEMLKNIQYRTILRSYYAQKVDLNGTNENFTELPSGSQISLKRGDDNSVLKINIDGEEAFSRESNNKAFSVNRDILLKHARGLMLPHKRELLEQGQFSDLVLSRSGELTFKVTYNGMVSYFTCKDGVISANRAYIGKDVACYVANNFDRAPEKGNDKIVRYSRQDYASMKKDAVALLKSAIHSEKDAVFSSAAHGNRNYSLVTGSDSEFFRAIADAAKEVGYDRPITISVMHCYPALTEKMNEQIKRLPAGSTVLLPQNGNSQTSSWNGQRSPDGQYDDTANIYLILGHYGAEYINSNNLHCVISCGEDKETLHYNMDPRDGGEAINTNSLDESLYIERLKQAGVTGSRAAQWMKNRNVRFLMACHKVSAKVANGEDVAPTGNKKLYRDGSQVSVNGGGGIFGWR